VPHVLTADTRQCIQDCLECHGICIETIAHCLKLGGRHAAAEHIRTLADCAQICIASADFMLRTSPDHVRTCEICAEICRKCAESCRKIAEGDETMRRCVDICQRCSQSCERMSRVTA
jgi:hypothetical protein